jgi:hypothetical protein
MAVTSGCVFTGWFIATNMGVGVRLLVGVEALGVPVRNGRGSGGGVRGVALAILGGASAIAFRTATTMRGL